MINLLPPDIKEAYFYGHRNVTLLRWVMVCVISLVGLVAISTAGLIYVHQAAQEYANAAVSKQESLKKQDQAGTQKAVKDITSNLKLAVQVLSKEVLFSKLLNQLATITPSNAILTDLNIVGSQRAVDISAMTTDYAAATQLQVNLSDPSNKLFTKADIITVTCGSQNAAGGSKYPCSVTVRALFTSSNPYLFINDGKQAS